MGSYSTNYDFWFILFFAGIVLEQIQDLCQFLHSFPIGWKIFCLLWLQQNLLELNPFHD